MTKLIDWCVAIGWLVFALILTYDCITISGDSWKIIPVGIFLYLTEAFIMLTTCRLTPTQFKVGKPAGRISLDDLQP